MFARLPTDQYDVYILIPVQASLVACLIEPTNCCIHGLFLATEIRGVIPCSLVVKETFFHEKDANEAVVTMLVRERWHRHGLVRLS
jgi:hypothetical protein